MLRPRFEELPSTIAFIAGAITQPYPGTGLPRDLPYRGLLLKLRLRSVVAGQTVAGNYFPEWPNTLIRRIRVQGTKAGGGGSVTLVNIRGEEAYQLFKLFSEYIPIGASLAGLPGVGGTTLPIGLAATANGTFDGYAYYYVPLAPPRSLLRDNLYGLQDFSIYSQVDLLLDFGTNPGTIASGFTGDTFTLTDFGLGSGSPTVLIHRECALPGKGAPINKFHYIYSSKKIAIQSVIGATFADQKITDLNAGNMMRFIMMRQYGENASVDGLIDQTAGVSQARIADNSNIGTFRVRVKVNGAEKARAFWGDLQERNRADFNQTALMPQGYAVFDWSNLGPMSDIFDARGFGVGAVRWELFGDGLNLAASDKMDVLQCEQVPVEV
jgi:hypothetical protein